MAQIVSVRRHTNGMGRFARISMNVIRKPITVMETHHAQTQMATSHATVRLVSMETDTAVWM